MRCNNIFNVGNDELIIKLGTVFVKSEDRLPGGFGFNNQFIRIRVQMSPEIPVRRIGVGVQIPRGDCSL